MILEILLMLRSSIVLLEDQPRYVESLWNHSNNYLSTTLDDFDLFDLPILDELEDFIEDFDYRTIFFDLGLTGYEKAALTAPPLPERIPEQIPERKQEAERLPKKKKTQPKFEKKIKYNTKKFKPAKYGKRKS